MLKYLFNNPLCACVPVCVREKRVDLRLKSDYERFALNEHIKINFYDICVGYQGLFSFVFLIAQCTSDWSVNDSAQQCADPMP